MKSFFPLASTVVILAFSVFTITGCQSSSSSGSGSSDLGSSYTTPTATAGSDALKVSSKVSVVDAQADSSYTGSVSPGSESLYVDSEQINSAINYAVNTGSFAAGSDYNQDQTEFWVHEDSVQAFNTVNEILCSIAQSKYSDMTGKGYYRAQIDTSQCSSSKDSASGQIKKSQNQSSASSKTEYENWVVHSSREDSQPQIVKVWIEESAEDEQDVDKMIMAKLEIFRSPTSTNPFGFFRLNFIGYPMDSSGSINTSKGPMFKGYMRTVTNASGSVFLQFSNNMSFDGQSFAEQATFSRSSDGSSGAGTLSAPVWGDQGTPTTQVFNIAYNSTHFLRQKGSDAAQCYNRSDFDTTVWDYSMYDNTGTRVSIDSGFPIKYASGTADYYGWVGYHGLWMPDEAGVSNGATVYKQEWSNNTTSETPYTVFIANGRLIKHTRKTMSLGDLKNVPLQWGQYDSSKGEWVEYRVEWNGSNLQKTATLDRENWSWTSITAVNLDLSGEWSFNFWSEALGGSGSVNIKDASGNYTAPSNASNVIFHVQDMVYPTDTVPTSLVCFSQCPDPAALANSSASTLTLTDKDWQMNSAPSAGNYYQYTFDTGSMLLKYNGTSVVMTQANSSQPWGFHSGMLFEPSSTNLNTVSCNSGTQTCNWQAWDQMGVYYTWETGPENWNHFTGIKDGSNNFARFDPPKKVSYTHVQADTTAYDYKYNGAKFQLEYSGFGNLHGIPGRCIDRDSGENISCDGNSRWIPEFSITPGTTVTDVNSGSTEYVLKPLHGEQRMRKVDSSACSSMSLSSYSLPGLDDWIDPSIGDRPTVSDAPAVIGGVVQ